MKTKIFHANNSALYFEYDGKKVIIDGIYGGTFYNGETISDVGMSEMPEEYEAMIAEDRGIFCEPDMLLFTHCHHDHYNRFKTEEYRKRHTEIGYYEPTDKDSNIALEKFSGELSSVRVGNMKIYLLPTQHLDLGERLNKFKEVPHYSFLLECGEEKIFVAGDGILDQGLYDVLNKNGLNDITCVFINVIHLLTKENMAFLKRINAKHIILYHLPFYEDDRMNYWMLMEQAKKYYPSNLAPLVVAKHMEWVKI